MEVISDFMISKSISGRAYEISVSVGPLGLVTYLKMAEEKSRSTTRTSTSEKTSGRLAVSEYYAYVRNSNSVTQHAMLGHLGRGLAVARLSAGPSMISWTGGVAKNLIGKVLKICFLTRLQTHDSLESRVATAVIRLITCDNKLYTRLYIYTCTCTLHTFTVVKCIRVYYLLCKLIEGKEISNLSRFT